jgi:thiosulfate/3-mercaptopyruvate sulfurtransferase
MGTIVSVETLADWLPETSLRLFDCRFSLADETLGRKLWEDNHVPGAQHVNMNRELSSPVIPGTSGRHPLPTIEQFVETLCSWGVANDSQVVAYDDASGAFAARLWWMLRWVGHENVHVLDGGYKAWVDAGQPVTQVAPTIPRSDFNAGPSLTRIVKAGDISEDSHLLLDARDEGRYRGENETIDPVAGHIPGAVSAPFAGNITPEQRFRPAKELRERFEALTAGHDDVVCYCGSGVTATHDILAMLHAGMPEPALYPGSWSEWITDPARPVETG